MSSDYRRTPLTTTSFAMLGLLAIQPWTTYELAQQMERTTESVLAAGAQQALRGAQEARRPRPGRRSPEQVGRRPRTIYSITGAGRQALAAWLARPSPGRYSSPSSSSRCSSPTGHHRRRPGNARCDGGVGHRAAGRLRRGGIRVPRGRGSLSQSGSPPPSSVPASSSTSISGHNGGHSGRAASSSSGRTTRRRRSSTRRSSGTSSIGRASRRSHRRTCSRRATSGACGYRRRRGSSRR